MRGALATPPSVLATSSYLHSQGRNQLQRCAVTWLAYVICAAARRASTSAQHRRQPCARHLQQKHLQRHISRLSFRTFDYSSSGVQRLRQPLDASSSATTQHLCLNCTCAFRQFLATTTIANVSESAALVGSSSVPIAIITVSAMRVCSSNSVSSFSSDSNSFSFRCSDKDNPTSVAAAGALLASPIATVLAAPTPACHPLSSAY